MSVAVTAAIALALALWAVSIYNRLVRARGDVRKTWSIAQRSMRRRHEVIAAVIEAAQGRVAAQPLSAASAALRLAASARGPRDALEKESDLNRVIEELQHAVKPDPVLAEQEPVRSLRSQLADLNSEVARECTGYNVAAASYNRMLETFPSNLVAGMAGFTRAEMRRRSPNDDA